MERGRPAWLPRVAPHLLRLAIEACEPGDCSSHPRDQGQVMSRLVVEFLDSVRVSGSDHAVMSSGLATSLVLGVRRAMERSER